jgi:antirestriction protein ArdC
VTCSRDATTTPPWLKMLKDDKRAIFTAASHSQKAADYLNSLRP